MTTRKKAPEARSASGTSAPRGRKSDKSARHGEPLPKNPMPLAERLGLPPKEEARKKSQDLAAPSESITMRVPTRGLELARAIAEKKGLPYQTYLKTLIHEGLERDKAILDRD